MSFRHGISVVEVDVEGGGLPPGPPLNALSFASLVYRIGQPVNVQMQGATPSAQRSILSGAFPAGLSFDWSTLQLTGEPLIVSEAVSVTFREELESAPNSPRDSTITFRVDPAAVTLEDLALGPVTLTDAMEPGAVVASVLGAHAGAAVTMEGEAFDEGALALNGDGDAIIVGAAGPLTAGVETGSFQLRQSLDGAENSPLLSGPFGPFVVTEAKPAPPLTISGGAPSGAPSGTQGQAYAFTPVPSGGVPPYSFAWEGDELAPFGLAFDSDTGALTSDEMLTDGSVAGEITVTDAADATAVLPVSIAIVAAAAGLTNVAQPSLIQPNGVGGWEPADPVDNNPSVFIDTGGWEGGIAPYSFAFQVLDDAADSVIVPRDSVDEVNLGSTAGLTLRVGVWCMDSADPPNEGYAESLPFGPIQPAFHGVMVGRYDFRPTIAEKTSPANVFPVCQAGEGAVAPHGSASGAQAYPLMHAIAADGTDWADCGLIGALSSEGGTGRLGGRYGPSNSTNNFRMKLEPGRYRIRVACGRANGTVSDIRYEIHNGPIAVNPADSLVWASPDEGANVGTNSYICIGDMGGLPTWDKYSAAIVQSWCEGDVSVGVWSPEILVTDTDAGYGSLTVRRKGSAAGAGTFMNFLDIKWMGEL